MDQTNAFGNLRFLTISELSRLIRSDKNRTQVLSMKDMEAHLDKLAGLALECAEHANQATEKEKQDLFARLAKHYSTLAGQVEAAIKAANEEQVRHRDPPSIAMNTSQIANAVGLQSGEDQAEPG
ncbi:hypothetical protein JJB98_02980 [Bradyrhizobium diazoefficiens]|nr:hypothetical protein [Bradyrhizobium diazoefficiens]QQO18948.1 hypothetical protein JJB98_02980 [Bradyrhizobium diazoefficiens]